VNGERHRRVKEVFLEACRLEPSARDAFVSGACAGDDELLGEVQDLLAHHRDATILGATDDTPRRFSLGASGRTKAFAVRVCGALGAWFTPLGVSGHLALGAAAVLVAVFGLAYWSQLHIERSLRETWTDTLQTDVAVGGDFVENWCDARGREIGYWMTDPEFRQAVVDVLAPRVPFPDDAAREAAVTALHSHIRRRTGEGVVFAVFNDREDVKGFGGPPGAVPIKHVDVGGLKRKLKRVWSGEPVVLLPHHCELLAGENWFGLNRPMIGIITPVFGYRTGIKYGLFIGDPNRLEQLNRALATLRSHESGEAFLCDRQGRMLNESRFPDQLVRAGILPEGKSTVLLPLRDPGVDLTRGERPTAPYQTLNKTVAVAQVGAGVDGFDVEGFRDYRGVSVIAGWAWYEQREYGMIVKLDRSEAYRSLEPLIWVHYGRLALLAGAIALILWSWQSTARVRRRLKDVTQIGPYALEGLIGEGGMGRVYLARHVLLKRPTAVKLIKPEMLNERTLAWFEREVELAGRLKHPNTVEIYDFGSTADGQFYCAMEFLNGLNLAQVVLMEGVLPAARVIHIIRNAAHSLREAHRRGMIHRDVKPQNIMLCVLGGEADVVKVLDFGLAKQLPDGAASVDAHDTQLLAGTPLYLAPERLRPPYTADARADIYSLGMTASKLLTGRDAVTGCGDFDELRRMTFASGTGGAEPVKHPIPTELTDLTIRCLSKNPADRPQSMDEVVEILDRLAAAYPWTQAVARTWWGQNSDRVRELAPLWDSEEVLDPHRPPAGGRVA
jgi:eukaryotic-like serine/threonine-protein kinase